MILLKKDTAVTIPFGPFLDDADGKTAETGLSIATADVRLSKNGGANGAKNSTTATSHNELGYYNIHLNATDTNTLGALKVMVSKEGALPVWADFMVVTSNVYDTFFSTGSLNVTLATSQPAITWGQQKIIADADGEGALDIVNTGTGGGGVGIHTEGQFAGQLNEGTGGSSNGTYNIGTAYGLQNYGAAGQYNGGSDYGVYNNGSVKAVLGFDTRIATASKLQTVDDNVNAVKAKTDNLPASPAAVGSAMTLTAAYDKAKDDVLTPLAVVDSIVDGLKTTLDNIHDTDLPAVKTDTAAIKAKTNLIPATPASAGEYTTNIGAIKAKTDNLPASPASAGEYTSALTAIQADLDNPAQYKADVSALATTAHVQEVENKVDLIDVTTVAIKGKTDQLQFTAGKVRAEATVNLGESDIARQSTVEQILGMFAEAQIAIIGNVQDGKITAIRGNDWELVIPCELPDDAKIQMAVKSNAGMRDDQSAIFLDSTTGLIYLDKDNGNAADGSLVYADGNLTLTLAAAATAKLCAGNFRYGIQSVSAAGKVVEKYQGDFIIYNDIVKATS